jgi:DNA polymerase-3 subunit gamma/tau
MAIKSLAVKYRPTTFDEVVEQGAIKLILRQQLESEEVKNAYLFCGGAGTGKTTCARIFANEINKFKGNPIEMDAASNSGVEDVRAIIQQAKTKSLDSEYKIFIIDECHSISNTGWQAFLKLIEEPPAKSIFIFCTTDPQKIPKTILSRVQRYDFQRISHNAVADRLEYICKSEDVEFYEREALDYIAKLADGGMRDAITLMDKCISYNRDLTIKNVVDALGITDYDTMFFLTDSIITNEVVAVLKTIEEVHRSGKDLKQFIKTYTNFVLDLCKYGCLRTFEFIEIPSIHKFRLDRYNDHAYEDFTRLLNTLVKLNADIKWETSPKSVIQAVLVLRTKEID